jgi:hypothetical protein
VGVKGQGAGNAPAQCVVHDKVQGTELRQAVTLYGTIHNVFKVRQNSLGRDKLMKQFEIFAVISDDRQSGPIAFVASSGVCNVA